MAGDWMKVEKGTPDKPEIAILAKKLGCSQGDAFLEWFRVYVWADGVTADGVVPFLSLSEGDSLSRSCPGTCAALASDEIGWIEETPGGLSFANWGRHNGKSAKARALDTDKKRHQRAVSRKCPDASGTKSGPEKRREEKKNPQPPFDPTKTDLPTSLDTLRFRKAWADWCRHRAEIKKPLKPTQTEKQLELLRKKGHDTAVRMLDYTVSKGWQGLREPEDGKLNMEGDDGLERLT